MTRETSKENAEILDLALHCLRQGRPRDALEADHEGFIDMVLLGCRKPD